MMDDGRLRGDDDNGVLLDTLYILDRSIDRSVDV